ncbi:MAG: hypothetical protein IIB23_00965 [Chloroflexi bacterium]|nr:hypothetical protein [Chloroflexota bacterium]MCH8064565.1 hypothetical protein [Chloroflexota bacterium]
MSLDNVRDVVIIVAGSFAVLVLVAVLVFTVVLGLASRALLRTLRSVLKDDLGPLLDSAQQTVQTVRGTTTFIGEKAVSPIIRVFGVVAGARRAVGVVTGVVGRRKDD